MMIRRALAFLGMMPPAAAFSTVGPMPIDQAVAEFFHRIGPSVSRDQALSVPAMLRGRNLICSISTLPLVQRNAQRRVVDNPLLRQFDPNVPNVVHLAQTVEDLVFESIAWWRVTSLAWTGYPYSVQRVDPRTVSLNPPPGKALAPLPSGWDPRDAAVWVDGQPVPAKQMLRFDSPNPGVLANGGRAIRRALALDQAAAMFADNPRAQGYFQAKDNADPADPNKVKRILNDWKAARKVRADGYVPSWLEYKDASSPTPADLQLVQLIQQATLEIANMLGLDPEELGVSTTSRTYANVTDRRKDKINDVYGSYMRAVTDRLSMPDCTPAGNTVQFDLDDYMKPDPATRWAVYETQLRMGATDVAEIRAREGWDDREIEAPAAPAADPVAEAEAVTAAAAAGRRFTFDRPTLLTFVDVPTEGFAVDSATRTVRGTILPYGRVSASKFEFAPGSLEWSDVGRVKLLRDHDPSTATGRATVIVTKAGKVDASFSVARGDEGDRALALAEDGVLDGFSVGVDFDMEADTIPHPRKKGVTLVRRATLREVSLTALPSFDDARVTSVAASLTGGNMPCSMCGQIHADGVACSTPPAAVRPAPASPAAGPALPPELAAAFAQFSGAALPAPAAPALPPGPAVQLTPAGAAPSPLAAAFAQFLQSTGAPVAAPGVVNPAAAPLPAAIVNEPAPYRFDRRGNLIAGAHDFGKDFISGVRDRDAEAYARVMKFAASQLSQTFDVITTDVNELNPTRNRPELYVDQRSFRYPIWDSIDKGTLTDITPFTFPKFNSAGTLVGNHTEGTEPSSGTFTLTGQTVTPTAKSGKIKISRETWDQGGNPQVGNLIWRQMVKAWFEMLEAAAVSLLDAASPASLGTFTAGGGTTGQTLARELKRYMSALHFVRGGFSMTDAMAQIDLYQHLVGAEDDTGRSLFPAIGPSNADGTVANRWQSVDVNGVAFNPAWALAATGSVAASSYLYDRDSVHGWASAPRQLTIDEIEVANVYIGLWGYVATAISDINGVRELIYDPVP